MKDKLIPLKFRTRVDNCVREHYEGHAVIMDEARVIEVLTEEIVNFGYRTKEGELRNAWGTLMPSVLPEPPMKKEGEESKPAKVKLPGVITYWDVEKKGFRNFNIDKIEYIY